MKEFTRSDEYQTKIFMDAFEQHVVLDAKIVLRRDSNNWRKLKAWCPVTGTNLQFPSKLREYEGQRFIADVIKSRKKGGKVFYRAYRKSIRDPKTGEVVG